MRELPFADREVQFHTKCAMAIRKSAMLIISDYKCERVGIETLVELRRMAAWVARLTGMQTQPIIFAWMKVGGYFDKTDI